MECVKKIDINKERFIWTIKDQDGNYCQKTSICKLNNKEWIYIPSEINSKTFSQESRGYITKESAEKALDLLNKKKIVAGFDLTFHIERLNLDEIIEESVQFQGNNLVICDKDSSTNPWEIVKACICSYMCLCCLHQCLGMMTNVI